MSSVVAAAAPSQGHAVSPPWRQPQQSQQQQQQQQQQQYQRQIPHESLTSSRLQHSTPAAAVAISRKGSAVNNSSSSNNKINPPPPPPPPPPPERNIDSVVLGDLLFKTWYASYHVKEIVGKDAIDAAATAAGAGSGAKTTMLERLYVCPHCFKYSKELVPWFAHVRTCRKEIPGRKIYTHGMGKGEEEEGRWSIWEVDGEDETLYCQNLSLFAKLFLDNKSVFFDVTGFNYFLLVHTHAATNARQVVGFFSKEKMSWDSNNLACILVFPPWQRKGLGALLIGASYEVSRREGVLGGPEKPISALGRRGYRRYWAGEIARCLLALRTADRRARVNVTLQEISRATFICEDDCLVALRDMDVAVEAGKGKGGVPRVNIDMEAIRRWASESHVGLERAIDPDGFVEGYGYQVPADDEMEG